MNILSCRAEFTVWLYRPLAGAPQRTERTNDSSASLPLRSSRRGSAGWLNLQRTRPKVCDAHRAPLQSNAVPRRGGRVVDRAGLETRKAARPREFESPPLRSASRLLRDFFFTQKRCL